MRPGTNPGSSHPEADDPFWDALRVNEALDRVDVPVLLLSGWQDLFLQQTLEQYRHLSDRNVTTALTVGSWTHTQLMTDGAPTVIRETLAWLDTHLRGQPAQARSPVRVHVTNDRLDRPTRLGAAHDRSRAVSATRPPTFGASAG